VRDLLTIVAALVIVALTAALAVPPLIDWGAQRPYIEDILSRAAGTRVVTGGAIDVRLLPSPRLKVEQLRLGGDEPGSASLSAAYFRTEIALTPLLAGDVIFRDTRMGRAEIRIPTGAEGNWRVPRSLTADAVLRRRWIVENLAVQQLLVTTTDPATGRTDQAYAEGVTIQGQSLGGPWRMEGTSRNVPFQLATGELGSDGTMQLKLGAGGGALPRLEVDGRVELKPGTGDVLIPSLAGTMKLTASGPARDAAAVASSASPVPILANANLAAAGDTVALDGLTLEAGEGGSALRLSGTGHLSVGVPRLFLQLEGRRFNLDAFIAASAGEAGRRSPASWDGLPDSIPLEVALKLDSISVAGEEWSGLSARASLSSGRVALEQFQVTAPGPAQITAHGEFGFTFAQGGTGHVSLSSRASDRLGAALARFGAGDSLGPLLNGRPLHMSADVVVGEPLISLRNLHVGLGDATLSGALRYTMPERGDRGRLDAQLALQGIDLMQVAPSMGLFTAARGLDVGLILEARNVGYGVAQGTGRIAARVASDGQALRVERLEIADLAGANANVAGRIEPDGTGKIVGRITARRAAPLLELAGPAWIGSLAAFIPPTLRERDLDLALTAERAGSRGSDTGLLIALKGRAAGGPFQAETVLAGGRLSRLHAELSAERLQNWAEGPALPAMARPAQVKLDGVPLPSGRLGLSILGDLGGVRIATTRPLALANDSAIEDGAAELVADDVSPLLILLGETRLAAMPAAANVNLTFGSRDERSRIGLRGRIADTEVTADLSRAVEGELGGKLQLGRISLPWLSSALALNSPGGGGTWPTARFGPPQEGRLQGQLAIEAGQLDLGNGLTGRNAVFNLAVTPDSLAVRDLGFALAEGRVTGEFTLARQGGLASLSGKGAARGLSIAALTGTDAFKGQVTAELGFGGSGESLAGIVANLGGAGTVSLGPIQAARADPGAVLRTVSRALRNDDTLAPARIQAIASEELDHRPLMLSPLSDSATLIGGSLRAAPLRGEADGASWTGSLGLDLRNLTIDARGALQAKTAPPGWNGDPPYWLLGWTGPLSAPRRTLDVGPLINGLASVVLTRELDRIDTFEADQNERQRRNGPREMERDRRAAQEAARQAAIRARDTQERAREAQERAQAAERARAAEQPADAPSPSFAPSSVEQLPPVRASAPPGG
jgi:hypothetical protein